MPLTLSVILQLVKEQRLEKVINNKRTIVYNQGNNH